MLTVYTQPAANSGARIYFAEFNRGYADSIRKCARRLEGLGLSVEIVPHKTTLRIERPADMAWMTFKAALRSGIKDRVGSVIVFATHNGRVFLCSNVGNLPGVFQRLH